MASPQNQVKNIPAEIQNATYAYGRYTTPELLMMGSGSEFLKVKMSNTNSYSTAFLNAFCCQWGVAAPNATPYNENKGISSQEVFSNMNTGLLKMGERPPHKRQAR